MLFDGAHGKAIVQPAGRVAAAVSIVAAALLASACEPTAFISPQTLTFSRMISPGAVGGQCTETSPDARPVLRFGLISTDQTAIYPGDSLLDFNLSLGSTFSATDIRVVNNSATLFPAPDVACGAGAGVGSRCPDVVLADAGFTCQPKDPAVVEGSGGGTANLVCALPDVDMTINPNAQVGFEGAENAKRAVIVMIVNGSSVLGLNGAGVPDRQDCSTDPDDKRTRAATLLLRQLGSDNNRGARQTQVCLATFTGTSVPRYWVPDGSTEEDCFQEARVDSSGFNFLTEALNDIGSADEPGGRNPWGALRDAIGRFDDLGTDYERHLVLLTDGDTDASARAVAAALGGDFDTVLQEALAADVTMHVAQFDRLDRSNDCTPETVHGAVDDFARLACATGGNYSYAPSADDLPEYLDRLGWVIPGHYEVEILAEALAVGVEDFAPPPLGPYKVAATIEATVDNGNESVLFCAGCGNTVSSRTDTRLSLFNRADCTSRDCQSGYVCRDDLVCDVSDDAAPVDGSGDGSGSGS